MTVLDSQYERQPLLSCCFSICPPIALMICAHAALTQGVHCTVEIWPHAFFLICMAHATGMALVGPPGRTCAPFWARVFEQIQTLMTCALQALGPILRKIPAMARAQQTASRCGCLAP